MGQNGQVQCKCAPIQEKATVEYFSKSDAEQAVQQLKGALFEEQPIEAQLVEEEAYSGKRHEIRKNYGNRFRQFSNNSRGGYRNQ